VIKAKNKPNNIRSKQAYILAELNTEKKGETSCTEKGQD
jgi:hypothetical protein